MLHFVLTCSVSTDLALKRLTVRLIQLKACVLPHLALIVLALVKKSLSHLLSLQESPVLPPTVITSSVFSCSLQHGVVPPPFFFCFCSYAACTAVVTTHSADLSFLGCKEIIV